MDGDLAQVAPVVPPYTQDDLDRLAALGADYVNISHPGLFTETEPFLVDAAMEANLDRLLALAARAKLLAVISFRTGPGRNEFVFLDEEDPGWLGVSRDLNFVWPDPADPTSADEDRARAAQDGWVAMWRHAAERYRHHPAVVGYDLMVEPNSNAVVGAWDPADFYPAWTGTLYDWNQLHPRLSAAIRAVDPHTPILTGSLNFSAPDWLPYLAPTADGRTVYTVHLYEPFAYTHQEPPLVLGYPGLFDADGDGLDDVVDRDWLESRLAPVDAFRAAHGVPVAANELGVKRWQPGAHRFLADQLALLEARGLSHALWVWAPADPRFIDYTQAFDLRLGPDPDSRAEVDASDLLAAVIESWRLNGRRARGCPPGPPRPGPAASLCGAPRGEAATPSE